jgi:hypothetical protein
MIKVLKFQNPPYQIKVYIFMLNSNIRHTIKPYAYSIVPIKRFNESICIYERQYCISNLVKRFNISMFCTKDNRYQK